MGKQQIHILRVMSADEKRERNIKLGGLVLLNVISFWTDEEADEYVKHHPDCFKQGSRAHRALVQR